MLLLFIEFFLNCRCLSLNVVTMFLCSILSVNVCMF